MWASNLRKLTTVRGRLGLDHSIIWATINRTFSLIKAPAAVYFIVKFLTPADQGLWYTFLNLGALTIFAELGFATIIAQFVSHEFANLNEENGIIKGTSERIDRFFSLIRFSIKMYLWIIPVAVLILVGVGYFFFKTNSKEVQFAWILFSLIGGLALLLSLLQAIYQGLDKVKETQINAFLCVLGGTIGNWIMLSLHFRIWALVIGNLFGLIMAAYLLYRQAPNFWNGVWNFRVRKRKYHFFKEIRSLQAKYAISWISGYFIFFLAVPATYKYVGAQTAGQLGITMTVISAIVGIANNWITTKIPQFNILVSSGDIKSLDNLFQKSLRQALIVQILLSVGFIAGLFFLEMFLHNFFNRFLPISFTVVLLVGQLAQTIIASLAAYLRSFKEEPFVYLSVVNAVLMLIAVFVILKIYGFSAFILMQAVILILIVMPMAYYIYKYKRRTRGIINISTLSGL